MSDFAPHTCTSFTGDFPAGYAISASSEFSNSFAPWKAFDGLVGSGQYWVGTGHGTDWLQLTTLLASYVCTSYAIQANTVPEPLRCPKNWTLLGSNDGTTWTTLDTQSGQTGWTSGQTRTFSFSNTTAFRMHRLNITANNGDANYTDVAELYLFGTQSTIQVEFAPHNMTGASSPTPYSASGSANFSSDSPYKAFDGDPTSLTDRYLANVGVPCFLEIDLGSSAAYILQGYSIAVFSETTRFPKSWTVQGSNDGTTWTTLDTRTNQTTWTPDLFDGATAINSYLCSTTTAYRFFKINITANTGDPTYTMVNELYLWGVAGSPASLFPIIFIVT
jgi:alpha-L-fucosidase 2